MMDEKQSKGRQWQLERLYASPTDPALERDVREFEAAVENFCAQYEVERGYLTNATELNEAIKAYEHISILDKPTYYLGLYRSIHQNDEAALALETKIDQRYHKGYARINFFVNSLGKLSPDKQQELLAEEGLSVCREWLTRVFRLGAHHLTESEESLWRLTTHSGHTMWIDANDRLITTLTVEHDGRRLPLSEAVFAYKNLTTPERRALWGQIVTTLEANADTAEAELNAIITRKALSDELRGYREPYSASLLVHQNKVEEIEALRTAVAETLDIPHRFYALKARLLNEERLTYADRSAPVGEIKHTFTYEQSETILRSLYQKLDPELVSIFDTMIREGCIDVYPRGGKRGGAFCASVVSQPTHILLNHVDTYDSLSTFAHEMGHAFHFELSQARERPLYADAPISTAEIASTLFENLLFQHMSETLSEEERLIALHDRVEGQIAAIYRQIALFNFETELHKLVRAEGYVGKARIAELMNTHMSWYLGSAVDLESADGYFFVDWHHIRMFFYVYSYAYGQLIADALFARYEADPGYWQQIKEFLSLGERYDPEEILARIGVDTSSPTFWREGLARLEKNLTKLENMLK